MDYYENQTYYDVLGLPKDGKKENGDPVSIDSITKARDRLKYGNEDDRVPFFMWKKIDEAYDVLSDPERRKEYDKFLEMGNSHSFSTMDNNISDSFVSNEPSSEELTSDDNSIQENNSIDLNPDNYRIADYENNASSNDSSEEVLNQESDLGEPLIPFSEENDLIYDEPADLNFDNNPDNNDRINDDIEQPTDVNNIDVFPINREPSKSAPKKTNFKIPEPVKKASRFVIKVAGATVGFFIGGTFASIGGAIIGAGVAFGVVSVAIKSKKTIKLKLDKRKSGGKITSVSTEESKLIEEYNKILEDQIYTLLSEPHNNYNLEIARLRFQNQIELLKKRIEMKKNEKPKRGFLTKYKLELTALITQLETAENRMVKINQKIDEYNKESRLSKLNKKISDKNKQINDPSTGLLKVKKLEIKKNRLLKKRDSRAKTIKLTNDLVGKVQDGAIKAYDVSKNFFKNVFVPVEKIDPEIYGRIR